MYTFLRGYFLLLFEGKDGKVRNKWLWLIFRAAAETADALFVEVSCRPQPSANSERRLAHRQGRRALKASLTLGVLLGLFFSAWLPFFIANMAQVSIPDTGHCLNVQVQQFWGGPLMFWGCRVGTSPRH